MPTLSEVSTLPIAPETRPGVTPSEVREIFERGLNAKVELDRMADRLAALSSPAMSSGMPMAVRSGKSDPTAQSAMALVELEKTMAQTSESLEKDCETVVRLVSGVRAGMGWSYSQVLEDRYINGLLWKQIAMIEGMSVATVHRYKEAAFEWIAQVGIIRAMEGCGTAEG